MADGRCVLVDAGRVLVWDPIGLVLSHHNLLCVLQAGLSHPMESYVTEARPPSLASRRTTGCMVLVLARRRTETLAETAMLTHLATAPRRPGGGGGRAGRRQKYRASEVLSEYLWVSLGWQAAWAGRPVNMRRSGPKSVVYPRLLPADCFSSLAWHHGRAMRLGDLMFLICITDTCVCSRRSGWSRLFSFPWWSPQSLISHVVIGGGDGLARIWRAYTGCMHAAGGWGGGPILCPSEMGAHKYIVGQSAAVCSNLHSTTDRPVDGSNSCSAAVEIYFARGRGLTASCSTQAYLGRGHQRREYVQAMSSDKERLDEVTSK